MHRVSLGLVFLQYRHETKRAILPNEITTLDTVRALFVRSFSRQLSMEYFDSHNVRIYIHDSNQDMFYELEDLRWVADLFFFYPSPMSRQHLWWSQYRLVLSYFFINQIGTNKKTGSLPIRIITSVIIRIPSRLICIRHWEPNEAVG